MVETRDKSILIIDDDETTLNILRRVIKQSRIADISTSLNATQALRLVETRGCPFSIILSDQIMPGMYGHEFFEQAAKITPDSRRLLITGHMDFQIAIDALNKGAIHQLLTKPWDNTELLSKIEYELDLFEKEKSRKAFLETTRLQNKSIFKVAQSLKKIENQFLSQINDKKKERASLEQQIEKTTESKGSENNIFQFHQLLSKNIVIDRDTLIRVFKLFKQKIDSVFEHIAAEKGLAPVKEARETEKLLIKIKTAVIPEADYENIDKLLQAVGEILEPDLFSIGLKTLEGSDLCQYTSCPTFEELAISEGLLKKDALKTLPGSDGTTEVLGFQFKNALLEKGLITRVDLARLSLKIKFIDTRLKDINIADQLQAQGILTETILKKILLKQINLFHETGSSVSIGELLLVDGSITTETKNEFFGDLDTRKKAAETGMKSDEPADENRMHALSLFVSKDKTRASIKIPAGYRKNFTVADIIAALEAKNICYGIMEDHAIEKFLKSTKGVEDEFILADGTKPIQGRHAKITYHFNTEYQRPGAIRKDGTIDFKKRGDVPYVKAHELLAEKTPLEKGRPGRNIYGEKISPDEILDVELIGKEGVSVSEDGLKIYALVEGQPCVDSSGSVSVYKEISIRGDVNYKTGNIDYNGNVVISGIIREGFSVTCVDLTVKSINGGKIQCSGDLNVSEGIVDSDLFVQGNIRTKYIKDSNVSALGNITVVKEIMDSKVISNGRIDNYSGRITGSEIGACQSLRLGQVGTQMAKQSTIKIGFDDHIKTLLNEFEEKRSKIILKIGTLEQDRKELEEKLLRLHKHAENYSRSLDQKKKDLETAKQAVMDKGDIQTLKTEKATEYKKYVQQAREIETALKSIFNSQDLIMKEIEGIDQSILKHQKKTDALNFEQKALEDTAASLKSKSELVIEKKLYQGTKVMSPRASTVIKYDTGPCKIIEIDVADEPGEKELTIVQRI